MFNSKKIKTLEENLQGAIQSNYSDICDKLAAVLKLLKIGVGHQMIDNECKWVASYLPACSKSKAKYELIVISSVQEFYFNKNVNQLLRDGFEPCGNVTIDNWVESHSNGFSVSRVRFTQQFKRKLK